MSTRSILTTVAVAVIATTGLVTAGTHTQQQQQHVNVIDAKKAPGTKEW